MRQPQDIKIGDFTLKEILERHLQYLQDFSKKDMCANLSGADLHDVNLQDVNLRNANLYGATLFNANLSGANLTSANLRNANLDNADLHGATLFNANLCDANLCDASLCDASLFSTNLFGADLHNADLCDADLCDADLSGADLSGADLHKANLCDASLFSTNGNLIEFRRGKILSENLTGYKICKGGVIVTLEIPRGATVFSINGNKCRTNKAKVIDIEGANRAYSKYNNISYYVGDEFTVYDFNCQYNVECAEGIHFYMTKEEAENADL